MPNRIDRLRTADELIAEGLKPRVAQVDNVIFPAPFITEGRELDRALTSLGLEAQPAPKKRHAWLDALAGAVLFIALAATLAGALSFMLAMLALFDPSRAS